MMPMKCQYAASKKRPSRADCLPALPDFGASNVLRLLLFARFDLPHGGVTNAHCILSFSRCVECGVLPARLPLAVLLPPVSTRLLRVFALFHASHSSTPHSMLCPPSYQALRQPHETMGIGKEVRK